ncbi:ATP-binding cassette subfamily B protein [Clostridium tetanomorphum]|uniref:ABC transporter ATP-binding protein n=1 Tax=Clostridium tetanomorphum TaxID=1553 RepID=UPI00068E5A28|nr:ABC transporter ATP-binding protein [Clostridium tetanomorphum]MBP1865456.1 ATP-binding cassette subfamily B protein [Clostridium tetanomorphum]NRS84777.1 ATP-binding cassette subfamily B protein [Clostridium tetanomorphum]SQB91718.1 transporter [Clostridium tetanomorphum]
MIRQLKTLLGSRWKDLFKPVIFTALDALGSIGIYIVLFLSVIDVIHGNLTSDKLWIYTSILVSCVVYRVIIYRYGYLLCFDTGFDIAKDVRIEFGNHITMFNLGFFNQRDSGYLLNTLTTDMANFEGILSHALPFSIKAFVVGVLLIITMLLKDIRIGLIQVLIVFLAIPLLKRNKRVIRTYGDKKRTSMNRVISIVMEYIDGMRVFKSHNMIGQSFERMYESLKGETKIQLTAEKALTIPNSLYSVMVSISTPVIMFIGGLFVEKQTLSVDGYIILIVMSISLTAILIFFEHYYLMLMDLSLALDNIEHVYRLKPLPYEKELFKPESNDIKFENVTFQYETGKEVLHGISFSIKHGTKTALVGRSGSGKSTVMNLIARLWDTHNGKITLGGENIKKIKPEALLENMSEVFQDNALLNDTIENNIRIGKSEATMEEIIKAAKIAHAHEFIIEMEKGYKTLISEGGGSLSGGERQRIAIARAILKDAPILILDESTASLDQIMK